MKLLVGTFLIQGCRSSDKKGPPAPAKDAGLILWGGVSSKAGLDAGAQVRDARADSSGEVLGVCRWKMHEKMHLGEFLGVFKWRRSHVDARCIQN